MAQLALNMLILQTLRRSVCRLLPSHQLSLGRGQNSLSLLQELGYLEGRASSVSIETCDVLRTLSLSQTMHLIRTIIIRLEL